MPPGVGAQRHGHGSTSFPPQVAPLRLVPKFPKVASRAVNCGCVQRDDDFTGFLGRLNPLSLGYIQDIIPPNLNRLKSEHDPSGDTNLGPDSIIRGRAQMALQPLVHFLSHRYFPRYDTNTYKRQIQLHPSNASNSFVHPMCSSSRLYTCTFGRVFVLSGVLHSST